MEKILNYEDVSTIRRAIEQVEQRTQIFRSDLTDVITNFKNTSLFSFEFSNNQC